MKRLASLFMRGGVLTALALLCLANAYASVTMYAVWYPTGYTNPSAKAYSGATIGGWFYVRAEVRPQSGTIISASVDASSLEELTSAHAVTPTHPQYDQYRDAANNMVVLYIPATLWLSHNATYRFRITVTYLSMTGPPPAGYQPFTESAELILNVQNMQLYETGSPPPYFLWDPASMRRKDFHVFLMHAQDGPCTVTLRIYRSDDNQHPIATRVYNLWRPDDHVVEWDGIVDSNPPTPAQKGVYLYEIEAVAGLKPNGEPDRDSNRSDYLFVRCPDLPAQMIGLSGSDVCYQVSYILTSAGNIPAYQPDSKIVVFGADLGVCHSAFLQSPDVTPGSHTIEVTLPWPPYDAVIFLVCPKDNHVHLDKAHRRRWALPHNQQRLPVNASVFNHEEYENPDYEDSAPKVFTQSLVSWGYKGIWWLERDLIGRIRYYGGGDHWPSIKRMRGALEFTWNGVKTLRVAMFAGHGSDDGYVLLMTNRDGGRLLVPSKQYYDDPSHKWADTPVKEYACLILDTIAPTGTNGLSLPNALANLDLVVLVGCSQVKGGLAEQFARMGAGAAVGVGKPGQTHPSETVFMEEFVRFIENGMPIKSAVNSALESARAIIERLVKDYGRIDYGDDPYVDAVVRGQRANAPLNYPYQQP